MASISRDPQGRRTIQFVGADGRRRSIRLGKVSQRIAEAVKLRVELLSAAIQAGHAPDDETARWVAEREQAMADKLAAVGLVPRREAATLGTFLPEYLATRTDVKSGTLTNLLQTQLQLLQFFGADKRLCDITAGDADEFRRSMLTRLGDNTVRRHCGRAKQFFRAAVRKRLIRENPFGDMTGCGVRANKARQSFISREAARQVMDACPDAQWRLLFALSRYGGLRCPSEHLGLRWGDIDWERGRMRVRSPKTEHHVGGESRLVPLFPELLPHLQAAFQEAEEREDWSLRQIAQ